MTPNQIIHQIGVQYFIWGWIVFPVFAGLVCGSLFENYEDAILIPFILTVIVGLIMLWFKYGF